MIRTLLAISVLAAGSFLVLAAAGPRELVETAPGCLDFHPSSPVVVFDISGFTLSGPLHKHLAVYDSGLASMSSVSGFHGAENAQAEFRFLPASEAAALLSALRQAGAFQLCDDTSQVSDLPLTTVTVLVPGTDGRAHSFSYWIPSTPRHLQVQQAIGAFIARHFPNF